MELVILGAAAGGGLPQWNCAGGQSLRVWQNNQAPQTQASVAIGSFETGYVVINASPDLRQQIIENAQLHPQADHRDGARNSPIKAVVITNADVDNVAGLLNLREKQFFDLYGPRKVLEIINDNPIFSVLDPQFVTQHALETEQHFTPFAGLELELFTVPGKAPLYLEDKLGIQSGDLGFTSGIECRTSSSTTLIISSCATIDNALQERINKADFILFDGTVFEDDEMLQLGLGEKTGRRMGHLPISAADGALSRFAQCNNIKRKLFFHINNSNPIWDLDSPQYEAITHAGWELSRDGMVIDL